MSFIHTALGISTFPQELKTLCIKYLCLQIIVAGIYLSYSWISLYYISLLDSFSIFGTIVAMGMICGALLDIPLGLLTDRFGQRIAFCCALVCLAVYYFGLMFAANTIDLLLLEIIVGIYSALISGSFIAWFMNSWEVLAAKEKDNELSFRTVMGNIDFAKTLIIAFVTFIGGYFLQQKEFIPQMIFFFQGSIAILGILLGFKFISPPSLLRSDMAAEKTQTPISNEKKSIPFLFVREKYFRVLPFFLAFSILVFSSTSFSTLIFAPLIYDITAISNNFHQADIQISFTSISLLLISIVRAVSDFIFAIASRFSGRMTSFIKSPYNGLLSIYTITFPVAWITNVFVLMIDFPSEIQIILIFLLFLIRIILLGLSTGLYWQFYLQITSRETRSSQESLFNTVNMTISILGFGLIGIIIEMYGFIESLFFLFIASTLGIALLFIGSRCQLSTNEFIGL